MARMTTQPGWHLARRKTTLCDSLAEKTTCFLCSSTIACGKKKEPHTASSCGSSLSFICYQSAKMQWYVSRVGFLSVLCLCKLALCLIFLCSCPATTAVSAEGFHGHAAVTAAIAAAVSAAVVITAVHAICKTVRIAVRKLHRTTGIVIVVLLSAAGAQYTENTNDPNDGITIVKHNTPPNSLSIADSS